jgi:uncharacterized protein YjbI with pentapeptide repeats
LAAFREKDENLFFGREGFTNDLIAKVKAKPLVAVVGASGSGKSSLVFAGLQPYLRSEGWLIEDCRPGSEPFYRLAEALTKFLEPGLSGNHLVKAAGELSDLIQHRGMGEVIASLTHRSKERPILLVIDQFEELFTCDVVVQENFLRLLLDQGIQASGLKIVVTLRADFCGQAYGDRTLTDAFQNAQMLVGPMNTAELTAAIEEPAKLTGLRLEPGLADRLLADIGQDAGNLPLLEFALEQLWERQEQGKLTHNSYKKLSRNGIKGALAKYADRIYKGLSQTQKVNAAKLFVDLVRLGNSTGDTRKVRLRSEIEDWNLVKTLADKRLVITGYDEKRQKDTVEIIHESLIREWSLLQQWLNKDRSLGFLIQSVEDWYAIYSPEKKRKYLLEGRILKESKSLLKMKSGSIRQEIRSFIWKSLLWRRCQTPGLLVIVLLVLGIPGEYLWREETIKRDYVQVEILGNAGPGEKAAVLNLAGGCWAGKKYEKIPIYARERFFGNCRSLSNVALEGADLKNVNLSRVNLHGANLAEAILDNTNLSEADLEQANLTCSDIVNSNLSMIQSLFVNFSMASIRSTNFSGAELYGSNLSDSNFSGNNLSGVSFTGANLSGASFSGANLSRASFQNSRTDDPEGVHFNNSNLSQADFVNANLSRAKFNGANLSGADFSTGDFREADFSSANLENAEFGCVITPYLAGNKPISEDSMHREIKILNSQSGVRLDPMDEEGQRIDTCPYLNDIKWDGRTNWKNVRNWKNISDVSALLQNPRLGLESKQTKRTMSKEERLNKKEKKQKCADLRRWRMVIGP